MIARGVNQSSRISPLTMIFAPSTFATTLRVPTRTGFRDEDARKLFAALEATGATALASRVLGLAGCALTASPDFRESIALGESIAFGVSIARSPLEALTGSGSRRPRPQRVLPTHNQAKITTKAAAAATVVRDAFRPVPCRSGE